MNATGQVQRLEALLGTIRRNAMRLRDERSRGVIRGGALALSEEATGSVLMDASEERLPVPDTHVASVPVQTPSFPEVQSGVHEPISGIGVSQPSSEGDDVELIGPDDFDEVEDDDVTGRGFAEASERPLPDVPSDLELELTDELAAQGSDAQRHSSAPSDDLLADRESRVSGELAVGDELDGMGVSLGVSTPPGPMDDFPGSIGEAMARVAVVETPRTPPPASGPRISGAPKAAYQPELEVDDIPVTPFTGDGPSIAQLGTTVDLEPAEALEQLELQVTSGAPSEPVDEYEASLPGTQFAGAYDESLSAPPNAREDLQALDRAEAERAKRISRPPTAAAPAETSQEHSVQPGTLDVGRVLRAPPAPHIEPALYESERPKQAALTFLQHLDRSLGLKAHS